MTTQLDTAQQTALEQIARAAGDLILGVYNSDDFDVEAKGDGSPLTRADRLAHEFIVEKLTELTPDIPVLSEESDDSVMQARFDWQRFWLVDPLDGTREFVKRNGEFTVNIALIDNKVPVFGVVQAPVLGTCYSGGQAYGAWCTTLESDGQTSKRDIKVTHYTGGGATVVASRSHRSPEVEGFIAALSDREQEPEVQSMGSSLKICLVADGSADIYPRLGPTSEWDTAAAHAVVLGAGGQVTDTTGSALIYNKESILNPWFLVSGGGEYPWPSLVPASS